MSDQAVHDGGDRGTGNAGPGGSGDRGTGTASRGRGVLRKGRRRTVARLLIEVVVLAAAAVFVVLRAGSSIGQVGSIFYHLHWHWLFVSLGAECISIFALSWLQQRILRAGGLPVGVRDLLPVTMASNAVAQSLPAGVLFAEGYAFRQYQRLGAGRALGVWAELSAGALAAAGLASVAVAGAVIVGPGLSPELLPTLAFVLVGALVASALFRQTNVLSALISRVLRFAERRLPPSACRHLRSAEKSTAEMACFRPPVRAWALCLGAAILNWSMDWVVLVMGLLTVGGPVPWRGVLLSYAAAQLLVELPITPGGLGVVEGGLVEVLTRFHVPVSRATAGTLMYRAVGFWSLLLVGWAAVGWLSWHNRRADRARAAEARPAG
ncbi:MAG: lysylphosphatidylglycerol synthase transmembrane domain-containing protein [Acidimicrobiales bacterium]